jgi:hypothetical protein
MPAPKGFGRPTIHTLGEILNALFSTVSKEWLPVVVASACSRVPYGEMAHRLSLRQRLGTEKALGWSVENWSKHSSAQRRPRRSALMRWAEGLAKEGKKADWHKHLPARGFHVLPHRWVVERSFACRLATTGGWA